MPICCVKKSIFTFHVARIKNQKAKGRLGVFFITMVNIYNNSERAKKEHTKNTQDVVSAWNFATACFETFQIITVEISGK